MEQILMEAYMMKYVVNLILNDAALFCILDKNHSFESCLSS